MVDAQPHEVTPTLAEIVDYFSRLSPMKTEVVRSEGEYEEAVARHGAEGRHLACASDAGLPHGFVRLTFLPASAFTAH